MLLVNLFNLFRTQYWLSHNIIIIFPHLKYFRAMKVVTPEISWHGKEAIFSVDIQPFIKGHPNRIVTAGLDSNVRVWQLENDEIKFLSNLSRHEKAVNVVKFSKKSLLIASAGDDGTIVLWKLSEKEELPAIFSDEGGNIEVWNAFKSLRGHLEDINDLSWSHDDLHLVSGSIDHSAILWDVEKGQKLAIFSDSKHFVNGVAWDPLNSFVATMSCDRSLRIYNLFTKKMMHCINKVTHSKRSDEQAAKPQRIFHDETVVRRRLNFTIDGKLLIVPAGCLQTNGSTTVNTVMIFSRNNLSKPCVYLPGLQEPACVVACCPVLFQLRDSEKEPTFKLDYRHVFAVASSDTVLLYDTQQSTPFGLISNIHYASITDLSWSSDATFLAISSRDGFCSLIFFEENELGERYTAPVNKSSVEIVDQVTVSPDKNSLEAASDALSNQDDNSNEDKENEAEPSKDIQPMEVDVKVVATPPSCDHILDKKVDSDVKVASSASMPRRIAFETLSTPGGNSSTTKEEVSSNPAPRRVQLIPVAK